MPSTPRPTCGPRRVELAADHVAFDAVTAGERVRVRVGIPGEFMVYNTLDVLLAAQALGVPLEKSAAALARVPHVKGRVEVVPTPGKDYTVLIDYAHSPDSLENVLRTVKGFAKGRTVALFGCGGDRDKTKRPKMGKIAADLADFVIVTSDNPRTEVPGDIIRDILTGMEGTRTPYVVVEDRVQAIGWAHGSRPQGRRHRPVRQGPRDVSGGQWARQAPHG
jgi:UDP-N-acetylmuramoyl-L-alanyl-D-glutamate--2,6-diaminopimelate ligase